MSSLHAVIVDDRRENIDVLAMLLGEQGLTCTAVGSPAQLMQILNQLSRVDIVFLDLEFPDESGFTTIKKLKADQRFQQVPIVAYTVHTSETNEARDAGFHSFLGKPLRAKSFPGQLQRILNNEHVWEV